MQQYRPDIDGLRALSIVAVVIYHAFPKLLPGGFVGVDIFFVISGYLITRIILQDMQTQRFTLASFYKRRIQRIVPAVLLILVFCLVVGWWVLLPYEYAMLGKQTGAAAVFAPNILFWSEAGYFDTDSRLKPLLHLWSLGVEEQFYLAWPLLLLVLVRLKGSLFLLIASLLLASFAASILVTTDAAARFFLPHFRVWELLAGALLACRPVTSLPGRAGVALACGGLALLVAATLLISSGSNFPGWWALLPTTGAALIIFAGPGNYVSRALGSRALVFIGKISFPLYLWHWPLLTFARLMESAEPQPSIRLAAIALSVALAWMSYRLVETPLRYQPGRAVPTMLITALLLTGAAGLVVMASDGFPQRTHQVNAVASALYWNELGLHQRDDCSADLAVPPRCLSNGKSPTIAVLGDSHSTNVFFALTAAYEGSDDGVVRLGRGGCPPLYGLEINDSGRSDTCLTSTAAHLDWVIREASVRTVYLSSMGPMYINAKNPRFALRDPGSDREPHKATLFAAALEETVTRLLAADKNVVLVIDWPGLGFQPGSCVDTRPLRLTSFEPRDCRTPRKRYDRTNREYRQILNNIAARHEGVNLWDTATALCDAQYCYGMRDGTLLYRDPGHLSLQGSRYLGERKTLTEPVGP